MLTTEKKTIFFSQNGHASRIIHWICTMMSDGTQKYSLVQKFPTHLSFTFDQMIQVISNFSAYQKKMNSKNEY